MIIDRIKTCAFSGHRNLDENFNKNELKRVIKGLIDGGFTTFLVGMAVGFDTVCFKFLEEFRKEYPIKIVACIPCYNQSYNFSEKQKAEYEKMLLSANERVYISKEYTKTCMFKRNMFMVDNSSVIIAYLNRSSGGTFNTVKYAERKRKTIIFVNK